MVVVECSYLMFLYVLQISEVKQCSDNRVFQYRSMFNIYNFVKPLEQAQASRLKLVAGVSSDKCIYSEGKYSVKPVDMFREQ